MKPSKRIAVHLVGIKGVGMTALAILLKEAGFSITGSDSPETFITDSVLTRHGIIPFTTFHEDHIKNVKLVITTGAHGGLSNPEVVAAKAIGVPVLTFGQALGKCMDGTLLGRKPLRGISIAGTHGKTTTTALLATIFSKLTLDPSYIIGTSYIPSLPSPGHLGKGEYFIAEADEYVAEPLLERTAKMLYQKPDIAVVTSIELDHPDVYEDLDSVADVFVTFVKNLPKDGLLVACGDSDSVRKLISYAPCTVRTYGFSSHNDYFVSRVFVTGNQTFFWVKSHGADFGEFRLNIPGEHNALNALACAVVAVEEGKTVDEVKRSLLSYTGSKRRLEKIGSLKEGAVLFDDYAHHPTEIQATLKTLRQMFPYGRITCVFQPHTYSRTKKLFDQFLHSFSNADFVILTDIYASARETGQGDISSLQLAMALDKYHKDVLYCKDLLEVKEAFEKRALDERDVVVTIGAGDIYQLHYLLLRFN